VASKRHKRRRGCEGKVRHTERADALQHLRQLRRIDHAWHLNIYRCRFCKGWHVGHAPYFGPPKGRRS
jgi:hypothetical protein